MAHAGGRPLKEINIEVVPGKTFYTVPEVCAITGMHPESIRNRLIRGELKGKKLGGKWKIYPESLTNAKVDPDLNIEK